ncbi:MAG: thiol:disulfide interchange protein DsbA/DsbL [Steroidobacteraceae bacterium]
MKKIGLMLMAVLVYASATSVQAAPIQAAPTRWVEGAQGNYVLLEQPQPTTVPAGKVEVMEVFSYACPFCEKFQPTVDKLERSLPRNAQMVFLPASFIPTEDWPMFQRAYFAAQSLGIAKRTHQAIYDAVWKTGELAITDPATNRPKNPLPSIEDAARCYSKLTGVSTQQFLTAARSFGVDTQMREADAQVMAMQIPGTPSIVVDGKYLINLDSLKSPDEVIPLVKFLVAKARTH